MKYCSTSYYPDLISDKLMYIYLFNLLLQSIY